jgi:phage baseplate assembly protein W
MPVILGNRSSMVLPPTSRAATPRTLGVTLPMQIGGTVFNMSTTYVDQVKTNIRSLLLTQKGERVMQPNLGSDLYSALFSQSDDIFENRLETVIEDAIQMWLPSVNVVDVLVDTSKIELNSISLSITFRLLNSNETNTVDIQI